MSLAALKTSLSRQIREEALHLGFFKVGITPAKALPRLKEFDEWLEAGRHGEMKYLVRQAPKRRDPGLVLQNARSILVLAMNYYFPEQLSEDSLQARISRYAWGDDYHSLMQGRLKALERRIGEVVPSLRSLSYVDTGPVMEKAWGAHSGLGWMGKHSNVITREHGSWFFIGVILLNIELAFDAPEDDHCGTCSRCIQVCPTGAIVAPYVVDARLCISYLTIELRGIIPRELRPLIGNRVFGCDDCQEACPWNRFAVETLDPAFKPRDGNLMPELLLLAGISAAEFNERFKNSPIRRAKRDGFVRNVTIALGNSHNPAVVPALKTALADPSHLVRVHAAWALRQIPGEEARDVLEAARKTESDSSVLEEMNF